MQNTRINRAATSKVLLPAISIYTLVAFLMIGTYTIEWWVQLMLSALATVMVLTLNNRHALIRIFSRSVSSSYMVLLVLCLPLFTQDIDDVPGSMLQVVWCGVMLTLLEGYQQRRPPVMSYYCGVCCGVCSLLFPAFLYFVPAMWIVQFTLMQNISLRSFCASVCGILTAHWLWSSILIASSKTPTIIMHYSRYAEGPAVFATSTMSDNVSITMYLLALLLVITALHFISDSSSDKIKIRNCYYMFIVLSVALVIVGFAMPQFKLWAMRMLIVTLSPMLGRYFTFADSRFSTILQYVILACVLSLTLYNYIFM